MTKHQYHALADGYDIPALTFDDLLEQFDAIEYKRSAYERILTEMNNPHGVHHAPATEVQAIHAKVMQELLAEADSLLRRACEFYEIEPHTDMHKDLSLKLFAEIHARENKPAGTPLKWDMLEKTKLVADVQSLTADGLTVAQACRKLIKQNRWHITSREDGQNTPAQTLERKYREFQKDVERINQAGQRMAQQKLARENPEHRDA